MKMIKNNKELNEENLKNMLSYENIEKLYNDFVEDRIAHIKDIHQKTAARVEYWNESCGTFDFIRDLKIKMNKTFNLNI